MAAKIGVDYKKLLEEDRIMDAIRKSLTCTKCNTKFGKLDTLKKHLKKCCPELVVLKTKNNPFRCDICNRVTSCTTAESFARHKKTCILTVNKCPACSQSFKNAIDFKGHKAVCCPKENSNPWCQFCEKTFPGEVKQSSYKNHLQMHGNRLI